MKRRISTLVVFSTVFTIAHCQSYEDSFNRNIDSTGLYVTNSGANTISQFGADPKSGILNDLGTVTAGTTPVFITLNSAGTFAYAINSGSNDIYVYSVSKASRQLTKTSSVSAGTNPRMIAFHKSGSYAYVINQGSADISKFSVNVSTGELTSLGATTAAGSTPVAIVTFNNFAIVADSGANELRLYDITPSTGAITLYNSPTFVNSVATLSVGGNPTGVSILAISSSVATIYAPTANNQIEYFSTSVWTATPATTQIATGTTPVHLALNPAGNHAFASNYAAGTISVYTVASGNLTAAGTVTACTNPAHIHASSANFIYVACRGENKIQAYKVSSGSLSLVGSYVTRATPTSIAGY